MVSPLHGELPYIIQRFIFFHVLFLCFRLRANVPFPKRVNEKQGTISDSIWKRLAARILDNKRLAIHSNCHWQQQRGQAGLWWIWRNVWRSEIKYDKYVPFLLWLMWKIDTIQCKGIRISPTISLTHKDVCVRFIGSTRIRGWPVTPLFVNATFRLWSSDWWG